MIKTWAHVYEVSADIILQTTSQRFMHARAKDR